MKCNVTSIFFIGYIDRLSMPKFMVCTGGDEFFLNDDSQFYWNEFVGDKYIRFVYVIIINYDNYEYSLELYQIVNILLLDIPSVLNWI